MAIVDTEAQASFNDLAIELISRIGSFLPFKSFTNLSRASKRTYKFELYNGSHYKDLQLQFEWLLKYRYASKTDLILSNIVKKRGDVAIPGNTTINEKVHFLLLEAIFERDGPKDFDLNKGLLRASFSGELQSMILFINYGANPNCIDASRKTPLMFAVQNAYVSAVKYLVTSEADVEAIDNFGFTVLQHAVKNNKMDMVNYLIELGADIHRVNPRGFNARDVAVFGRHFEIEKVLGDLGVESHPDYKVKSGRKSLNVPAAPTAPVEELESDLELALE